MKNLTIIALSLAVTGCVTVDAQKVESMPSGYLCSLLNPNAYISTAAERQVVFDELKERGEDCPGLASASSTSLLIGI